MAGSVEIAFENEFVEIQRMLMPVTENVILFSLDSELFFPFIVASGFRRGKGRQDYILSAFEIGFCFSVFLCL